MNHIAREWNNDRMSKSMRRRALLLILLLAAQTLGCITLTLSTSITHPYNPGDEQFIWFEAEQQIDSAFSKWAHEANVDMQAQYGAAYKPSMRFPETIDELPQDIKFIDPEKMKQQGFVKRADSMYLLRYGKRFLPDEYDAFLEGKKDAPAPRILFQTDPNTGVTFYRAAFTFPGLGDANTWKDWKWDEYDQWRAAPLPPKPKVDLNAQATPEIKIADEQAKRALALSGMDRLIGGAFSAISDIAPTPLQEWWAERILKEMGFPTLVRFEIDLPGKITRHEMNGQPEGEIVDNDKVVFALNETFLRKHGFMGPWTFVVESYVEPKPPEKEDAAKSSGGQPTATHRRFRLRAVGWAYGMNGSVLVKKLKLPVLKDLAPFVAYYELTELDSSDVPVRRCLIRFIGGGLSIGSPATLAYSPESEGSVFVTNRPARLEDFDGISGSITSFGGVFAAHSKITFGGGLLSTPENILGGTSGWDLFLGLHGGWSPMSGRWDIVEAPRTVGGNP
jgi:hypothetical protein